MTSRPISKKVALRAKRHYLPLKEETMSFYGYEPEENGGYSAYDEYQGIFGPIGTFAGGSGFSERSWRRPRRAAQGPNPFTSSSRLSSMNQQKQRRHMKSKNEIKHRAKYLCERQGKRQQIGAIDLDGDDDDDQEKNPIWLPPRTFQFRQRAGKLDTRSIARLDLQKIVDTTDIDTIQRHLENLAFADVTLEDVQQYSDAYFLKLFQISQLTLEYLLNVQDSLVDHTDTLENQCQDLVVECQQLEKENDTTKQEMKLLRKEIQQKQNTIATFEVMLMNSSSSSLSNKKNMKTTLVDNNNQENQANVGNYGSVPCGICGKLFLSNEYLTKHQLKKHTSLQEEKDGHQKKLKQKLNKASDSESSSDSDSDSNKKKKKKKKVVDTTQNPSVNNQLIPSELVLALQENHSLSRQLQLLQDQLSQEKLARNQDTLSLQQQQTMLNQQIASSMSKLQETIQQFQLQQLQQVQQSDTSTTNNKKKKSYAGQLLDDEEDEDEDGEEEKKKEKDKIKGSTLYYQGKQITGEMYEQLMREMEKNQLEKKILQEMNQQLKELTTKQKKTKSQHKDHHYHHHHQPPGIMPTTSLLQMMTLEAQRFGIDIGQYPILTTRSSKFTTVQEEKEVVKLTEVVQPVERKQKVKSTPVVVTIEDKTPKILNDPSVVVDEKQDTEKMRKSIFLEKDEHLFKLLKEQELTHKDRTKRLRAAQQVSKVALGFLTRKTLSDPNNWLISLPLTKESDKSEENQEITVEVTSEMTANDLRIAFAELLTQHQEQVNSKPFDYHRILLHDKKTGKELNGATQIYAYRGQLEIEFIPDALSEEIEQHLNQLVEDHKQMSSQLQHIRRASINLQEDIVPSLQDVDESKEDQENDQEEEYQRKRRISLAIKQMPSKHLALIIRLQAVVRGFLAKRHVQQLKLDHLIDARLANTTSITTTTTTSTTTSSSKVVSPSLSSSGRRSSSVVNSSAATTTRSSASALAAFSKRRESVSSSVVSTAKMSEQILTRLNQKMKEKSCVNNKLMENNKDILSGRMSEQLYQQCLTELLHERKQLPEKVQSRISLMLHQLDTVVQKKYPQSVQQHVQQQQNTEMETDTEILEQAKVHLRELLAQQLSSQSNNTTTTATTSGSSSSSTTTTINQVKKKEEDIEEFDPKEIQDLANAYEQEDQEEVKPEVKKSIRQQLTSVQTTARKDKLEETLNENTMGRSPRPKLATVLNAMSNKTMSLGSSSGTLLKGSSTEVISPFSKTPLISRRGSSTSNTTTTTLPTPNSTTTNSTSSTTSSTRSFFRRGSGMDNAR